MGKEWLVYRVENSNKEGEHRGNRMEEIRAGRDRCVSMGNMEKYMKRKREGRNKQGDR